MVLTLTSNEQILTAAGEGASSSIIASSAWVIAIGTRAEQQLCADTRYDWIGDYSSVDSSVKGLLGNAAAALAGKIIANYSKKGYFSTSEQETIIDVNTDIYNNAVKTLSGVDTNKIRDVPT